MGLLICKDIYAQVQNDDDFITRSAMNQRALTGGRIRSRRLDLGLRQVELAQKAGISASYLNLIEHNRRRIGGKLLADLARALTLDPATLAEGTEGAVLDSLRIAASAAPIPVDLSKTEDFATRFPDWAALLAAQTAQIDRLDRRVAELTTRLTHDPQLAGNLHSIISAVTAIRSTASILVNDAGIDRDWQDRFHRNINDDARKLADTARALVDYLERPEDAAAPTDARDIMLRWFADRAYHLPQVEAGSAPDGPPGAAGALARPILARYAADALALPLDQFGPAAKTAHYDPGALAATFGVGLPTVLRRLASLSTADHPAMGLAVCDGAGGLVFAKPIDGFDPPRATPGCPLWPLYQALAQPGRGVRADVTLSGTRFRAFAVAEVQTTGFDAPPLTQAVMLVQPGGTGAETVGQTCRICPSPNCRARREPSILG